MTRLLAAAALFLAFAAPALAQTDDHSDRVAARLVAEQQSAKPGSNFTIALEQVIRPGWHTYWLNAGDVGQPTAVDWVLPTGWKSLLSLATLTSTLPRCYLASIPIVNVGHSVTT